ncbi:hypothetical protein BaRGS_00037028 [Batillaria attramentaria]|uniref:Secreted protein n=1 Tax=Batillaria attramentaria TaxID=370345 RepID=A0ABD0J9V0_9CAEN
MLPVFPSAGCISLLDLVLLTTLCTAVHILRRVNLTLGVQPRKLPALRRDVSQTGHTNSTKCTSSWATAHIKLTTPTDTHPTHTSISFDTTTIHTRSDFETAECLSHKFQWLSSMLKSLQYL